VPELGGGTGRAAIRAPADHDPAADAGSDREHHELARDERAVVAVGLGEPGAGRVVVDEDRNPQLRAQDLTQRHVVQGDVHRRADPPRLPVDDGRHRDPDGGGVARRSYRGDELCDERARAAGVGRPEHRLEQGRAVQQRHCDLGAADVHADEPLCHAPLTLPGVLAPATG